MKLFKIAYNCFMWAMVIAITCFQNSWLQMRVNTGYIFLGSWLILSISLFFLLKKRNIGIVFSVINLVCCIIYGYILYGWKRLQIVPASLIREGIHQQMIKFSTVNRVILIFLLAGFLMILYDTMKRRREINI